MTSKLKSFIILLLKADVVKLANTHDSKSCAERLESSSLSSGTKQKLRQERRFLSPIRFQFPEYFHDQPTGKNADRRAGQNVGRIMHTRKNPREDYQKTANITKQPEFSIIQKDRCAQSKKKGSVAGRKGRPSIGHDQLGQVVRDERPGIGPEPMNASSQIETRHHGGQISQADVDQSRQPVFGRGQNHHQKQKDANKKFKISGKKDRGRVQPMELAGQTIELQN